MQFAEDKPEPVAVAVDTIHASLAAAGLLGPAARWALLGFPRHSNVGDSAIWLGSASILERFLGSQPALVSVEGTIPRDFDLVAPDGPIFLHGGGNFGDIWPGFNEFRVQLLEVLAGRKVIQLPQTIHYSSSAKRDEMRKAIAKHGNFTLFVRDRPSFDYAQTNFDCATFLCPDMAFGLGPLAATHQGENAVFSLMRRDRERQGDGDIDVWLRSLGPVGDWVESKWRLPWHDKIILSAGQRSKFARNALMPRIARVLRNKARSEVERGINILNAGQLVVTDRLHAHILCVLIGKPHVVLDNSYGKVFNYISTWPEDGLTHTAKNSGEIAQKVADLRNIKKANSKSVPQSYMRYP